MFSVAEFSPLQKFSLCIFALFLQDSELNRCEVQLQELSFRVQYCIFLFRVIPFLFIETRSTSFLTEGGEVLQQNSQSSQQCQCGWMCGSWLWPAPPGIQRAHHATSKSERLNKSQNQKTDGFKPCIFASRNLAFYKTQLKRTIYTQLLYWFYR